MYKVLGQAQEIAAHKERCASCYAHFIEELARGLISPMSAVIKRQVCVSIDKKKLPLYENGTCFSVALR